MVSLFKSFGVIVVVMMMLLTPSKSSICDRTLLDNYGCRYNQLSSNNTLCVVETYSDPDFSFYIKTGNNLKKLMITMDKRTAITGLIYRGSNDFEVDMSFLQSSEEWYKIQLSSERDYFSVRRTYYLSINDQIILTNALTFTRVSMFTVWINGSPFYGSQCNPEDSLTWWIYAIIGVAIFIIIAAIVIAVVIRIKLMKRKREDETSIVNEERGSSNTIFNDPDWHIRDSPSFNFNESDDPANHHSYDGEHTSEDVKDLRGPITFVNDSAGQSVSFHHAMSGSHNILNQPNNAWQSNRASVHDSENSFYDYR